MKVGTGRPTSRKGAASHKTSIFMSIAMRTSNLAQQHLTITCQLKMEFFVLPANKLVHLTLTSYKPYKQMDTICYKIYTA